MIKKISNNVKKVIFMFAILTLMLNITIYNASANETTNSTSNIERGQKTMSEMMGKDNTTMDNFMDEMMGKDNTQQMYKFMGKISTLGLSANDTKPLGDFISACNKQYENKNIHQGGMMEGWSWNDTTKAGLGLGGLFFVFMGIVIIVFWVIIILTAIVILKWLIKYLKRGTNGSNNSEKATSILKERYAKDEITKEEFEKKKKDIK